MLRRVPSRAALLNHERRVVTANTPYFVTGARVRLDDPAASVQVLPVLPDLGWNLVLGSSG